jgi:hypothetical protein
MIPRKAVKDALRAAGLSSRQTHALLAGGWAALVGDVQAEAAELRDRLDALTARFESLSIDEDNPVRPDLSATDGAGPEADQLAERAQRAESD